LVKRCGDQKAGGRKGGAIISTTPARERDSIEMTSTCPEKADGGVSREGVEKYIRLRKSEGEQEEGGD